VTAPFPTLRRRLALWLCPELGREPPLVEGLLHFWGENLRVVDQAIAVLRPAAHESEAARRALDLLSWLESEDPAPESGGAAAGEAAWPAPPAPGREGRGT